MSYKTEHALQVSTVRLLRFAGYTVFAVPNGGSRHKLEAAKLKREGVTAGVADLVIMLPTGKAVFVEMKTTKGRQHDSQKIFQAEAERLGFDYLIWRSIDDAHAWIQNGSKEVNNETAKETKR